MTITQNQRSLVSTILESNTIPGNGSQVVWLFARVAVGLLMIHNGFSKLADVQGFAERVIGLIGLPYPIFFTYCAAYVEIGSSILLALGVLTRLNAIALLFTMSVAVYFHLKGEGFHVGPLETASLYGLFFLLFAVNGGGAYSIDALLSKWVGRSKD